jgi:hypothetical protein
VHAHGFTQARVLRRHADAPPFPYPVASFAAQWLATRAAAVRHVALPNLVLRRDALPEAVFGAATPATLAGHMRTLLEQPGAAQAQQARARCASQLAASAVPVCSVAPLVVHAAACPAHAPAGAVAGAQAAAAEFLARVAPPALDAWLGAPAAARPRPSAVAAAAVLRRVGARLAAAET